MAVVTRMEVEYHPPSRVRGGTCMRESSTCAYSHSGFVLAKFAKLADIVLGWVRSILFGPVRLSEHRVGRSSSWKNCWTFLEGDSRGAVCTERLKASLFPTTDFTIPFSPGLGTFLTHPLLLVTHSTEKLEGIVK